MFYEDEGYSTLRAWCEAVKVSDFEETFEGYLLEYCEVPAPEPCQCTQRVCGRPRENVGGALWRLFVDGWAPPIWFTSLQGARNGVRSFFESHQFL